LYILRWFIHLVLSLGSRNRCECCMKEPLAL
jgi:hypothetical protein